MKRLVLVIGLLFATPASAEESCAAPQEFLTAVEPMRHVHRAIAEGRDLVIVALGGASTEGVAAGSTDATFPARLATRLRERNPGLTVEVVNAGRAREVTRSMVKRLTPLLLERRPHLVIWETGTTDAVRKVDPDEFRQALQEGIRAIRASGADALLMDFQYGRGPSALIDFDPYFESLYGVADILDVTVFHRYDVMRYWYDSGRIDLGVTQGANAKAVAAELYDCIALRLSDVIDRAAR